MSVAKLSEKYSEPLVSLDEFNTKRREQQQEEEDRIKRGNPNGIACPTCGEELRDRYGIVLTSNPPQKPVFCIACNFSGSRYL